MVQQPEWEDKQFIAFENINHVNDTLKLDDVIQVTVFRNSKAYDSLDEAKSNQNADIIFDRKDQKYYIDVKYNKTLVEERREILKNKQPPLAKNVLAIFSDTVSRQAVHMQLPKTMEFLKKYTTYESYKEENKYDKNKFESYEFYRYNAIQEYTYNNAMYLLYGDIITETADEENRVEAIFEYFKNQGFITAEQGEMCELMLLWYSDYEFERLKSPKPDYSNLGVTCDPNYTEPNKFYGLFSGFNSILRRCLYGKHVPEYGFEYINQFWNIYKDEHKFVLFEDFYAHELTGEVLNYFDDILYSFLTKFESEGNLEDTVIMFFSDHGFHMSGGVYRIMSTESMNLEIKLPMLFLLLPPNINKEYGNNVAINQQKVVSMNNIHHFLKHIAYGNDYSGQNMSLLSDLKDQKDCYSAYVPDDVCACL